VKEDQGSAKRGIKSCWETREVSLQGVEKRIGRYFKKATRVGHRSQNKPPLSRKKEGGERSQKTGRTVVQRGKTETTPTTERRLSYPKRGDPYKIRCSKSVQGEGKVYSEKSARIRDRGEYAKMGGSSPLGVKVPR